MTNRQLVGAQSRALGAAFERQIEISLAWYKRNDIAVIDKTPEPMKPIKPMGAGRFVACYTHAAQVDYAGTLTGGRSVRFEAKATTSGRFEYKRVSGEQLKNLCDHAKRGACCFVLCAFAADRVYRLPWWAWEQFPETLGRKYWTEADADTIGARKLKVVAGHINILDGITFTADSAGRDILNELTFTREVSDDA